MIPLNCYVAYACEAEGLWYRHQLDHWAWKGLSTGVTRLCAFVVSQLNWHWSLGPRQRSRICQTFHFPSICLRLTLVVTANGNKTES